MIRVQDLQGGLKVAAEPKQETKIKFSLQENLGILCGVLGAWHFFSLHNIFTKHIDCVKCYGSAATANIIIVQVHQYLLNKSIYSIYTCCRSRRRCGDRRQWSWDLGENFYIRGGRSGIQGVPLGGVKSVSTSDNDTTTTTPWNNIVNINNVFHLRSPPRSWHLPIATTLYRNCTMYHTASLTSNAPVSLRSLTSTTDGMTYTKAQSEQT